MSEEKKRSNGRNGRVGWMVAGGGIPLAILLSWAVSAGAIKEKVFRLEESDFEQTKTLRTQGERLARLEGMAEDIKDIKKWLIPAQP